MCFHLEPLLTIKIIADLDPNPEYLSKFTSMLKTSPIKSLYECLVWYIQNKEAFVKKGVTEEQFLAQLINVAHNEKEIQLKLGLTDAPDSLKIFKDEQNANFILFIVSTISNSTKYAIQAQNENDADIIKDNITTPIFTMFYQSKQSTPESEHNRITSEFSSFIHITRSFLGQGPSKLQSFKLPTHDMLLEKSNEKYVIFIKAPVPLPPPTVPPIPKVTPLEVWTRAHIVLPADITVEMFLTGFAEHLASKGRTTITDPGWIYEHDKYSTIQGVAAGTINRASFG